MIIANRAVLCLGATTILGTLFLVAQARKEQVQVTPPIEAASGREMFLKYCASCHGKEGKGDGPAAIAMKAPLPDLTTLAKRNKGKFPAGYVGALVKFGKSLASHGSDEMPVWGSRFREIDPIHDPTVQRHVDVLLAYIEALQLK